MSVKRSKMWLIAGCIVGGVIVTGIVIALALKPHRLTLAPPDRTQIQVFHQLHPDQCEWPNGKGAFVEPQNTWSNLGYLLVGLLILLRARSLPGIFFGAHLAVLAFFSAFYHATVHLMREAQVPPGAEPSVERALSQTMDVVFVYAALLSAIVYGIYSVSKLCRFRVWDWVWWILPILVLLFDIAALAMKLAPGLDSTVVFIAAVGLLGVLLVMCAMIAIALGSWQTGDPGAVVNSQFGGLASFWAQLILTLVVGGVGFFARLSDGYRCASAVCPTCLPCVPVEKLMCIPKGALQAHALWHVLSAMALLLTYDLFAQFQKAGDEKTQDQPVVLDQFIRLWSGRAWMFTVSVLVGLALLVLGMVRSKPSVILLFIGGFLFVTGLLFLIISFVKRGDPMDWS